MESFSYFFLFSALAVSKLSPQRGELEGGFLLESLNSVRVLDDLDGVGSELAAGHEFELSLVAKVLAVEVDALSPSDVDLLDVLDGEVLGSDCALRGEAGAEGAHVAEGHAVAFEDKFAEACNCLLEDGVDVASVVNASVVGDVLGELFEGDVLTDLCLSVGHGGIALVGLLRSGFLALDGNTVVNHGFKSLGLIVRVDSLEFRVDSLESVDKFLVFS